MKKRILIIGNGAKEYALAKNLSEKHDVYVAPENKVFEEFATGIDYREDDVNGLLKFVIENKIDMTIPISHTALKSDIVSVFVANKQSVFGPTFDASNSVINKAHAKKMLYKLHIPTPKFGIFEKENVALDYLKNQEPPFILKTNDDNSSVVLVSAQRTKNIINSIFIEKNSKIIVEDYIYGVPFSFYALTDGYKALPLGSSMVYKHLLDGDGGQLTSGMGACSPNYKLSLDDEYYLMDNVIYPTIEYFEAQGNPYTGIIGLSCILSDSGKIYILGYKTFMDDCDAASIIENLDEDLFSLFQSCIIGSFSDEKNIINQKPQYSVSLVLRCNNVDNKENVIKGLETLDEDTKISFYKSVSKNKYLEYEVQKGNALVITTSASTVFRASEKVYDEVRTIDFKGLYYRHDILKGASFS